MECRHFEFKGEGKSLFTLVLKNIFLTLITLGIYYPFARTEIRKYFWNHLEVEGEKFHYSGTGWEMLKGYSIVVGSYLLFVGVSTLLSKFAPEVARLMPLVVIILAIYFGPIIVIASRGYLLSRTSLRGVNLSIKKEAVSQLRIEVLKVIFLGPLTFGLYYIVFFHRMRSILFNNMSYGSEKFRYESDSWEFFMKNFLGGILSALTLGIYSAWLAADIMRFNAERTYIQGHNFSMNIIGKEVFIIYLKSLFFIIITLGLATPWVISMNLSFYVQKLKYNGDFDYSAVEQVEREKLTALGDAFGDALDIDLGI